jgi:hypothetical protein
MTAQAVVLSFVVESYTGILYLGLSVGLGIELRRESRGLIKAKV